MPFLVTISRPATIHQGLRSPVRAASGLGPSEMRSGSGRPIQVRIGVGFDDSDLTDRGWCYDTDSLTELVDQECWRLESDSWTQLFSVRPTMEVVSRDLFRRLRPTIARLAYVELDDLDLGVVTQYAPSPDSTDQ